MFALQSRLINEFDLTSLAAIGSLDNTNTEEVVDGGLSPRRHADDLICIARRFDRSFRSQALHSLTVTKCTVGYQAPLRVSSSSPGIGQTREFSLKRIVSLSLQTSTWCEPLLSKEKL